MADARSTALITPSYKADFDRCRLLCDSVERFVEGSPDHYILVDDEDFELFEPLRSSRRHIINENDILPPWLHGIRPGVGANRRKMWVSTRTWPLRGWHVQQLRRMAIARHVSHSGLLYCDSDMLFVRPFDLTSLWQGDDLRLYRKPNGINDELPDGGVMHRKWTQSAARLNGLPMPAFPAHDYINNLVSWRREWVVDMCAGIESRFGRNWVSTIGRNRTFSECQIYGAYADGVKQGDGHWHAPEGLCATYWSGKAMNRAAIDTFVGKMLVGQVAIGIQSFTQTSPDDLRYLLAA